MRIDRPVGNESQLTGSFSGSFYGDFTGEVAGLSGSIEEIYEKIDEVSSSISGTLGNVSHSISGTIAGDVQDLNDRITQESSSISGTISVVEQDLQSQIDNTRSTYTTTQSFNQYQTFVDETYYKSGSQATLDRLLVNQDATIGSDVWIQGNLKVEGSSSVIHTEDVSIADHFVTIASGALDQQDANGAGFGIDGANVTMSYHYTSGSGEYVEINKPFKAPSFLGHHTIDGGGAID